MGQGRGPMEALVSTALSPDFWTGKRILLTGHTGFKGAWCAEVLLRLGAKVTGLALAPEDDSLFVSLGLAYRMDHRVGDIRDKDAVEAVVRDVTPDIVLHMAAQSLVIRGYESPVETWATNVQGTVHLVEVLRASPPQATVIVTTDKVYENQEWPYPYRETDRLGGHDPYAASKAACELACASYRLSFPEIFAGRLATARAGNVIGGGDWAKNRIVPDLARAWSRGEALQLRNPHAVRPWQHVLDPVVGYLLLAQHLAMGASPAIEALNFGPKGDGQRSVVDLVALAGTHWSGGIWHADGPVDGPKEATLLALAIDQARGQLGWSPNWDFDRAVKETVEWYRDVAQGADSVARTSAQIDAFLETL